MFAAVPAFADMRARHRASDAVLLDRHRMPLHWLRVDPQHRRTAWVQLDRISPRLLDTVVQLEDRRFRRHGGVDFLALAGAAAHAASGGRLRGGSTLSMQVAALLEPRLRPRGGGRSLRQKWAQMRAAWVLEAAWTKDQILEAYLNLASFRGEIDGVGAASRMLLGKAPQGLDSADALLLASLLAGPNHPAAAVASRACSLARRLTFDVACARLTERANHALAPGARLAAPVSLAPHVAHQLLDASAIEQTTTLDAELQGEVLVLLQRQLAALASQNVHDGAALVVDNALGEVLAYVGNAWPRASRQYVDGVRAARQAGSALKPLLYELAIERRLLTAASLLDDSPLALTTPSGLYVPQNYDRRFQGLVSLRRSLAGSLNIPAVRALLVLGPDEFLERLRRLGFTGLRESGDYYGYALALGSTEATLWQLVGAYRALANGGRTSPLTLRPGLTPASESVMDPRATFVIADILADRASREIAFGADGPLATSFWSAVKTGMSKNMRDNWCVGFTDRYTVGVWVGNFDGSPMWDVSGLSGAAPVWSGIVSWLHRERPGTPPRPPSGLVRRSIRFAAGREAAREEWFIAGTETSRVEARSAFVEQPHIVYPGRDSVLVIDPDIPADRERVLFRMAPPRKGLRWVLNDRTLGGDPTLAWAPEPGRHRLRLVEAGGRLVDEIAFEVGGQPSLRDRQPSGQFRHR